MAGPSSQTRMPASVRPPRISTVMRDPDSMRMAPQAGWKTQETPGSPQDCRPLCHAASGTPAKPREMRTSGGASTSVSSGKSMLEAKVRPNAR